MGNRVPSHYDTFLAGRYAWISGGFEEQVKRNSLFFSTYKITPGINRVAIDLGAGCGFQSVPLARAGYCITAVDSCSQLLDELRANAGSLPVTILCSDIRNYPSWSGKNPSLIVCMGDTLTHLSAISEVENLVRQCFSELVPGGRLVLTFRDYLRDPDGTVAVIPVRREPGSIFVCRLEYHPGFVTVRDILYFRQEGRWQRNSGTYTKIRVDPAVLAHTLRGTGFAVDRTSADNGMITMIARKTP